MSQTKLEKFLFVKSAEEIIEKRTTEILPLFESCSFPHGTTISKFVSSNDAGISEYLLYFAIKPAGELSCPRCQEKNIETVPDYDFDENTRQWTVSHSCPKCGEFLYKTVTFGRATDG